MPAIGKLLAVTAVCATATFLLFGGSSSPQNNAGLSAGVTARHSACRPMMRMVTPRRSFVARANPPRVPPGGDGYGAPPPMDKDMLASMMNDPAVAKQYKEAMNNPDIQRMVQEQMRLMQSPAFIQKIEDMRKDPEMAAVFQELESGGMEAMMKYYNDPTFISKLSEKMGDMSSLLGAGGPGAAGAMANPMAGNPMAAMQGGANPMAGVMQDPDMMDKFQQLASDPELAPLLQKIREGGPESMQSAMADPTLLQKFSEKMQQVGIDQNRLAAQMQGGATPGAPMQSPAAPAAPAGPEIETLLDAARYGDTEAAEDLTYVGKDVNARDSEMRTPIHWACAGGHSEIAQILIDNGCDLTAVDSKGNTPLHYATGYSQPDLARILLDAGAPTDVKNKNGKTSKDVVTLNPNNPIAGLDEIMSRL